MQAEVAESLAEVGHVGLAGAAQHLARHKVGSEAQLLGDRQHQRTQARQVPIYIFITSLSICLIWIPYYLLLKILHHRAAVDQLS